MQVVVTGTDTDVGKTIFAAALTDALGAHYWKPVQAGLAPPTDAETVVLLTENPGRVIGEAYRLLTPCSPHRAAEMDGVAIDPAALIPPSENPLVIEGAGGVLVPLQGGVLYADIFSKWQLPVVLVARTSLGTINHSLLSIEALRARSVPILGIAFAGEANEDSETTICALGRVKRLGRLPIIRPLDRITLSRAFRAHFDLDDFR